MYKYLVWLEPKCKLMCNKGQEQHKIVSKRLISWILNNYSICLFTTVGVQVLI